ncbi:Aspartyl/glutamyl-tRNA(Asn/Gln) amidotransferase subunit C [Granulibacter bethesdensis]|uniref:Aspartyl/glutamyl-tRNA(Asn/Gln) amidotransferase subunit C n=3 Tax=Granulibacter bethesdensis TaxID=364410 RepID=Q0BTK3_GRABC|nr:Aspartyl/glutamyl-tRNA(Asn/Gln) amidotransferase subunit C [Granulibacter bethesdensis CGDNIH1]AHJ62781.1 Aspartyl/glutamyl-tRNA(Asn/Gln) amidotransferase subunit C [Granulibacter bethesdensis]AHJ66653.1 Aspartyl/glutamyl-tRNA(Asn/Gln) amidotransferase subunit C [Granulibacter bethesdensis CGDNIH4]AHJ69266.1 Aspartyl/glutamyl-tRNA(Asn/Gln) amidotransferase subunit C [Granulibacter bethesdensis]APH51660.1 Aspartyl/glutamyl-tRNA(Asn/Gln) amidotransferase subunit C [Granulibacter bethesdensis]
MNRDMRTVMVRCFWEEQGFDQMALDTGVVRRIARLARIHVDEADLGALQGELNAILGWVDQLEAVDVSAVDGIAPMTGPADIQADGETSLAVAPMRDDVVTEGDLSDKVLANAPDRAGPFFAVPKVVE